MYERFIDIDQSPFLHKLLLKTAWLPILSNQFMKIQLFIQTNQILELFLCDNLQKQCDNRLYFREACTKISFVVEGQPMMLALLIVEGIYLVIQQRHLFRLSSSIFISYLCQSQLRYFINIMLLLKRIGAQYIIGLRTCSFATGKRRLSVEAQKAVWATKIINQIVNMKEPSDIENDSFYQSIRKLSLYDESFEFSEDVKQSVTKIFDVKSGVDLDTGNVFMQNSIKKAKQVFKDGKFVFCPNYLITKHMFQQLAFFNPKHNDASSVLVTGGFGVSKTTSTILFITLAFHQTNFFCKARQNELFRQELKQLQEKKLLEKIVPKYWYWSIDLNHAFKLQIQREILRESLIAQAAELEPEQIQQIQNFQGDFSDFPQFLVSFYPKNVISRPLVDQINSIPSLYKHGKIEEQKFSLKTIDQAMKKLYTNYIQSQYFLPTKNLLHVLSEFKTFGQYYFFNSSSTIELEYLQTKPISNNIVSTTKIVRLPYESILDTEPGKIDFWKTFWFEIERRLVEVNTSQKMINEIKTEVIKYMKLLKPSPFSRFLYIRKIFEEAENLNIFKKAAASDNTLSTIARLKQIIDSFPEFCAQKDKERFLVFYNKGDQDIKNIILTLNCYATISRQNPKKANKPMVFSIQSLKTNPSLIRIPIVDKMMMNNYEDTATIEDHNIKVKQQVKQKIQGLTFAELLPFQVKDGIMRLAWTTEQFYHLSNEALNPPQIYEQFRCELSLHDKQLMFEVPPARGQRFEYYLRKSIGKGTILGIYCPIESKFFLFPIYQSTQFRPFNHNKKLKEKQLKKSLKKRKEASKSLLNTKLEIILSEAKNAADKYIFGIPYYIAEEGETKFAYKSSTIDFLIIQYSKSSEKFQLFSFDATISPSLTAKHTKAKTLFTYLISEFKSLNLMNQIEEINHIIICPQPACLPSESISVDGTNIKFMYADGEVIYLRQYVNESAFRGLNETIMLNKMIIDERKNKKIAEQQDEEDDLD